MLRLLRPYILIVILSLWTSIAAAKPAPESFADLVEELIPTVVNISTEQTIEVSDSPFGLLFKEFEGGESPLGELPELFEKFYGNRHNDSRKKFTEKATSLGSGFIISADGYIVTNNHVIEKADEITVIFSDEEKAKAKIIGRDPKTDIALLKVNVGKKLTPAKWGNSDKARIGDWVLAIGNPFGLGGSVSAGIISARARDINAGPFDDFIQTDAAINRGNSGGPLFNVDGEVIGVNTAIFSPSGGNVGIGFSTPSVLAEPVIRQLKEYGRTYRGWLGVKIQTVTDEIAESLNLDKAEGALVLEVTPDSPAQKAEIMSGDIILKFDGRDVYTMRKLPRIVAETKVGKKVPVVVWRKGKEKTLVVEVAELDEDGSKGEKDSEISSTKGKKQDDILEGAKDILGMKVHSLTDTLRKKFDIDKEVKGVIVVEVKEDGAAIEKGIRSGDIIEAINQEPVTDPVQAISLLGAARKLKRKSVLLLINRHGETRFVALSLD